MESHPRLRKPSPLAQIAGIDTPSTFLPFPSSTSKLRSRSPNLLTYDEIPEWYQDNDCIRHGYRPETNSASGCVASWIYLHNETVNIYSHLLPALLFLILQGVVLRLRLAMYPHATTGGHLVFAFFLLTAAICLGMSTTYHTLMNHSQQVSLLWLRLDFVGIVVLTLGDFVSGIYLVFYCEFTLQKLYWSMVRRVDDHFQD